MNYVSFMCVVLVTLCLVVDVTHGQIANCATNNNCSMTTNFKLINVQPPGQPASYVKVCCKLEDGIQSMYFRAASATSTKPAFCECDFTHLNGTCERGEQCTGVKATTSPGSIYGMKICCPTITSRVTRFARINGTRDYDCQCSEPNGDDWTGNCWKASQCNGCDAVNVISVSGLKLCCPNCQKNDLRFNARLKTCSCNA